jgi:hypothetical protein
MSIFASEVRQDVVIDDITVTIRQLAGKSLRKASEAKQIALGATVRSFGPDLMASIREKQADQSPEAKAEARYAGYDYEVVLTAGIVRWNDPRPLIEGIADLPQRHEETLFKAILDLSLPAIDAQDVEKNA